MKNLYSCFFNNESTTNEGHFKSYFHWKIVRFIIPIYIHCFLKAFKL